MKKLKIGQKGIKKKMNSFNKLYNLILESIVSQNKASRAQLLANVKNSQAIQQYLNTLDNKLADFLAKFFASGQLKSINDPKIIQVKHILANKPSINTQQKISLKDFLAANKQTVKFAQTKVKYSNLNAIPQLTKVKEYDNGVVIYTVEDSPKGMRAVRDIIDVQWGKDANPWCLAARTGKNNDLRGAGRYWKEYSGYPKHIAFQNGKLLAFSAGKTTYGNEPSAARWWDRQDKPHYKLPLLDGTQMKTDQIVQVDIFERYGNDLKLNPETNRYDYSHRMRVSDAYLVDGHFPIPFGVINGEFDCNDCETLQTLENAPTEVKGQFTCGYCHELKSLKGMPQKIGRGIFLGGDYALESLEGMPEICNGTLQAYAMKSLKSLKGCSQIIKGSCYLQSDVLQSLQGGPQEVHGNLNINGNVKLKNLKGIAQKVKGGIGLYKCESLQSLEGISPDFHGEIVISECPNLKLTQEDKKKYKFVQELSYYG